MRKFGLRLSLVAAMAVLGVQGTALAQASRTWISGVGDDANPCSRTAPCRTWAGAISKTAAQGEIDALDPGPFGAVTITKAITLAADGELASTLASGGTSGIVISAGVNDEVTIRGIEVQGVGTGIHGIRFVTGKALHVVKCAISQFTTNGIEFVPSTTSDLYVSDRDVGDNGRSGITLPRPEAESRRRSSTVFTPTTTASSESKQRRKLAAVPQPRPCIIASPAAIRVPASCRNRIQPSPVHLMLNHVTASFNGAGFQADGISSTMWVGASEASGNVTGMLTSHNGALLSYGDNQVNGNTTDGAPSGPVVMTK
jgi:hypothetical protein